MLNDIAEQVTRYFGNRITDNLEARGLDREIAQNITEAAISTAIRQIDMVTVRRGEKELADKIDEKLSKIAQALFGEDVCDTCTHKAVCHYYKDLQEFTKSWGASKANITQCPMKAGD